MKKFFSMLALASLSLSSFAQDATTQEKYSVATNSFGATGFMRLVQIGIPGILPRKRAQDIPRALSRSSVPILEFLWHLASGILLVSVSVPRFRASGVSLLMLMAMMLPTRATVISTGLPMNR